MVTTRPVRQAQKALALRAKAAGVGSSGTAPRLMTSNSLISRIAGGAVGFVTGGVGGAIAGAVTDPFGGGSGAGGAGGLPSVPVSPGAGLVAGVGSCPPGYLRVGSSCVNPGAALPGGKPLTTSPSGTVVAAGGEAVVGAFGLPARAPVVELREHRNCGPGMVLGKDNLCYPKAVLPRRSRMRKWRPGMKPLLTGADRKALRKAESLRNEIEGMAKGVGLHVYKTARKSCKK